MRARRRLGRHDARARHRRRVARAGARRDRQRPAGRARARPRRRSTPTSRRRQQGYGRSPRQQIETDEVEVLAGLRHGRTLGTPLALVVRNRDHANWTWGMSPWPPEGEPAGQGHEAGDAAAARATPTSPASLKYGLADVRDALERASARHDRGRRRGRARSRRRCSREIGDRGRRARCSATTSRQRDRRGARRARHGRRRRRGARDAACRRASARTRRRRTASTRGSRPR